MITETAPYLVITYTKKDEDQSYDWNTLGEWAEFEQTLFEFTVSEELFNSADLILDVLNGKIRKSNLKNVEDQTLIEHYNKIYQSNIIGLVQKFFKEYPEAWTSLLNTVNEKVKELDKS